MKSKTNYLIVKGSGGGGLGDRIRCVLTTLAYAKLTNRCLYVDWSDGKLIPQRCNVFFQLFTFKQVDHTTRLPQSGQVYPPAWQGRLADSLHDLYTQFDPTGWDRQAAIEKFSFDLSRLDYPHQTLVMWDFDQLHRLLEHYPQQTELELLQDLASRHMAFHASIRQKADDFKQNNHAPNEKVIAVHIRSSDEFRLQKNGVEFKQYIKQIHRYMNDCKDNAKIFLATDNSDIERTMHAEFKNKVTTRHKWFAAPGDKIHFNSQCPDPWQALEDACVELNLLAAADYLIYQYNSSFGISAQVLSDIKPQRVTALAPKSGLTSRFSKKLQTLIRRN